MSKRKTFRRCKVWGYHPGKRGQIFSRPAPKSQAFGILPQKGAAAGAEDTNDGKQTPQSN